MAEQAPDFVYVIYITARAEEVWKGLTDREMTRTYWKHYNVSEWTPGARWEHVRADGSDVVDIVGEVVESDPPRRLVITWAFPDDAGNEAQTSRVTFELMALGPDTKLTVIHSGLLLGTPMHDGITSGWPAVGSNLKSLLETGRVLSKETEDYIQNK